MGFLFQHSYLTPQWLPSNFSKDLPVPIATATSSSNRIASTCPFDLITLHPTYLTTLITLVHTHFTAFACITHILSTQTLRSATEHSVFTQLINSFIIAMSSYNYNNQATPSSPTYGFFPAGNANPHAFAAFGQSPRDQHAMYASLASVSKHPNQSRHPAGKNANGSSGVFAKITRRK